MSRQPGILKKGVKYTLSIIIISSNIFLIKLAYQKQMPL